MTTTATDHPTCEYCGRCLVRLTVRWLSVVALSDYCENSPDMFHKPVAAKNGTEGGEGR